MVRLTKKENKLGFDIMELTVEKLIEEAKSFCDKYSTEGIANLYGVTDGKAVGTYIEHLFKEHLSQRYTFDLGNSARGIDLPSIVTDIKVTSIKQPQSSSPFKSARQKVYGLGYDLIVFVYDKSDDTASETANMNFVSCSFIKSERTADFTLTSSILRDLEIGANEEDLIGLFRDKNLPGDDITYTQLAEEILQHKPKKGYLTISNALQWRLQYKRVVGLAPGEVDGIVKIV